MQDDRIARFAACSCLLMAAAACSPMNSREHVGAPSAQLQSFRGEDFNINDGTLKGLPFRNYLDRDIRVTGLMKPFDRGTPTLFLVDRTRIDFDSTENCTNLIVSDRLKRQLVSKSPLEVEIVGRLVLLPTMGGVPVYYLKHQGIEFVPECHYWNDVEDFPVIYVEDIKVL